MIVLYIVIALVVGLVLGYKFCMFRNKVKAIMELSKLLIRLLKNEVTSKGALKEIEEIEKL